VALTKKETKMRARLLKDIVIPAGTIFEPAPKKTRYMSPHAEHLVAFGNDSCGSMIAPIDEDSAEWFEPLDGLG
jgi:hypothetical protein